jgi:integrase
MNDIEQLLTANRVRHGRRFRVQKGTLLERRDGHYLRYYINGQDGSRHKVTERLCDLDEKKLVIGIKLSRRMNEINLAQHASISNHVISQSGHDPVDLTLTAFWERHYAPYIASNKAASTVRGYAKLWTTLEPIVGGRSLRGMRRSECSDLLTDLVRRGWGRRSVQHAQYLLQGMFSRAIAREFINDNPMKGAKSDLVAPAPKERIAYTDAEVIAVLNAIPRTDAKLFWSICSCLGTRPSEAAGLRWEDGADDRINIKRAAPYGVPTADVTKSELGKRSLLLIEPVKSLLAAWRAESGSPSSGWLFSRPGDRPINHANYAAKHIRPFAEKAIGSRWCGCYSGRHAVGTQLVAVTGAASATHQALGNTYETSVKNYVHPVQEAGDEGLRLREAQLLGEIRKANKRC